MQQNSVWQKLRAVLKTNKLSCFCSFNIEKVVFLCASAQQCLLCDIPSFPERIGGLIQTCQRDFTFIPNTFAHVIFCLPTFTGQLRALFIVLKLNYSKAAFWNGWRYIRFIDKLLTALLIQLQNGGSCLSLLVRRGTISAFCLVHNDAAVRINVQNDTRTISACGVLT